MINKQIRFGPGRMHAIIVSTGPTSARALKLHRPRHDNGNNGLCFTAFRSAASHSSCCCCCRQVRLSSSEQLAHPQLRLATKLKG